LAGHLDGVVVDVRALHVRHVHRRRQQLDHAVEHGLHALVLERRAAEHRHDLGGQRTDTQRLDDFSLGQLFAAQVLSHQLFRSDLRVISMVSSSTSVPFTSGTSTGDGSSWITPSSMACTPLFLNAEPQNIGTISVARVRTRSASMISASASSSPPRYFSISSSLASAAVSIMKVRASSAVSTRSAGMSPYSNFMPCEASSQWMAFIFSRSTTPLKPSSAPIGTCIGTGTAPSLAFSWSRTLKKLAPVRSILLTNAMRGTWYLLAWRHTVSDCG